MNNNYDNDVLYYAARVRHARMMKEMIDEDSLPKFKQRVLNRLLNKLRKNRPPKPDQKLDN